MKHVKCKSGLWGWRVRLRKNYANFDEFSQYSGIYGLAKRLGFKSARSAWEHNPLIEGSIEPSDFRKVRQTKREA